MTRQQVLDLYFLDARHKLIEIAAFLDRLDRAGGEADFRLAAFRNALRTLDEATDSRAVQVLMAFSDPTMEPIAKAPGKGACGAYPEGHDSGTHEPGEGTGPTTCRPGPPTRRDRFMAIAGGLRANGTS